MKNTGMENAGMENAGMEKAGTENAGMKNVACYHGKRGYKRFFFNEHNFLIIII